MGTGAFIKVTLFFRDDGLRFPIMLLLHTLFLTRHLRLLSTTDPLHPDA